MRDFVFMLCGFVPFPRSFHVLTQAASPQPKLILT